MSTDGTEERRVPSSAIAWVKMGSPYMLLLVRTSTGGSGTSGIFYVDSTKWLLPGRGAFPEPPGNAQAWLTCSWMKVSFVRFERLISPTYTQRAIGLCIEIRRRSSDYCRDMHYKYKLWKETVFCQAIVRHFSRYRYISITAHQLFTLGWLGSCF